MVRQKLLFTPGPLKISERVLNALRNGNMMHRDIAFSKIFNNLQKIFLLALELDDSYAACFFNSTGHGANEAMLAPYAKHYFLAVISNGTWGATLLKIARTLNPNVKTLECPANRRIDPQRVIKFLDSNPDINALAFVHQETRSGILNSLSEIADIAKSRGIFLLVDAMSSAVVEETDFQKNNVAFFTCSSTKGFRSLPGIGVVCGKKDEFEKLKQFTPHSYYLDLFSEYESQNKRGKIRFAQSTVLLAALHESILELLEEGVLVRRSNIHERTGNFRQWAKTNGIDVTTPLSELGNVITNFKIPPPLNYAQLSPTLQKRGIFLLYTAPEACDEIQVSFFGEFSDRDVEYLKKNLLSILKL